MMSGTWTKNAFTFAIYINRKDMRGLILSLFPQRNWLILHLHIKCKIKQERS